MICLYCLATLLCEDNVAGDLFSYSPILLPYLFLNTYVTLSTFFYCNVDTTKQDKLNRTYEEQILIKEIVWLKKEDAIKRLKEAKSNVDILVQRRDLLALEYYLNNK